VGKNDHANATKPGEAVLRAGGVACCTKINSADPRVVEIAAMSGVDSVWLCNEHVPNTLHDLENQIRAAKMFDVDPIVRVARGGYSELIRPLEMDAAGIIVPHIMSAADAARSSGRPLSSRRPAPRRRRQRDGGYCAISSTPRSSIWTISTPRRLLPTVIPEEGMATVSRRRRCRVDGAPADGMKAGLPDDLAGVGGAHNVRHDDPAGHLKRPDQFAVAAGPPAQSGRRRTSSPRESGSPDRAACWARARCTANAVHAAHGGNLHHPGSAELILVAARHSARSQDGLHPASSHLHGRFSPQLAIGGADAETAIIPGGGQSGKRMQSR